MAEPIKIASGTVVPGWQDKIIEEFFGNVNTQSDDFSLARMTAPEGWSEPDQIGEFDELSIVLSGSLGVLIDGKLTTVGPGETCLVRRGIQVGYSNTGEGACHYWSLCLPAFKPERNQRIMDEPVINSL